jgi:O-acetyl-ADP-ribose deacetylase (regulator of RNase III)
MPILFISLNERFCEKMREQGMDARMMRIQEYIPSPYRRTYYVSPANSLCFMDGGMDLALSREVFPGVESEVKMKVRELGVKNIIGQYYLPIGSSLIVDHERYNKSLVISPTMLLPQNVSETRNAYYATMAVLYNILVNREETLENVDILLTSFCCGYGKMDEEVAVQQIMEGIRDYKKYRLIAVNKNAVLNEPNLGEQPKYYQNTGWFHIEPSDIVNC